MSLNSTYTCIQRPTQAGKTQTAQTLMKDLAAIAGLMDDAIPLNIWFSSNSRDLVGQTVIRMNKDIYGEGDDVIEGEAFSWMSGTRVRHTVRDLAYRIIENEVSMVVCCAHKVRFRYTISLIESIQKSKNFNRPIYVWIDEADSSIDLWSLPEFDMTIFNKVKRVFLVSATMDSLFKKFARLPYHGMAETHPDCYQRLSDVVAVTNESPSSDAVDYLTSVFPEYADVLCNPGVRLFAPGNMNVASHDAIADFLCDQGFAVLVLNGQGKCVILPTGETLPVKSSEDNPEEIGKIASRMYREKTLSQYPFAVTGYMCLGRGLTFQNADFLFDFGIVSMINNPAAAYQCVGRMLGNVMHLDGHKAPTLVMPKKMWDQTFRSEKIAIRLPQIAFENKLTTVGEDEILEATGEEPPVSEYAIADGSFESVADARAWVRERLTCPSSEYHLRADGCRCLLHIKPCSCQATGDKMFFLYRGKFRKIESEEVVRRSKKIGESAADAARIMPVDYGRGANTSARIMPVDYGWGVASSTRIMPVEGIRYIVIYHKKFLEAQVAEIPMA